MYIIFQYVNTKARSTLRVAFSLIELSIVLVILGLLAGGILAGQNLIRSAQLKSVTTQYDYIRKGIELFRDQYNALPGDMYNATEFWGAAHSNPTSCMNLDNNTPPNGTKTCNGNGNGIIGNGFGNIAGNTYYENFRAWQHLSNAQLISGAYAGVTDSTINVWSTGPVTTPDWNVPGAELPRSGFLLSHWNAVTSTALYTNFQYNHLIVFGRAGCEPTVSHCYPYGKILTPKEAYNIDIKIDDGFPGKGQVMTPASISSGCHTSQTDRLAAEYNLQSDVVSCAFLFLLGW